MPSQTELEIYRAHRSAQDRYDYLLLAAAGAAIGFALNQTKDMALAWTQVPLGLAVLAWGASFYCGCRRLVLVTASLMNNMDLLQVQSGSHPAVGNHPAGMIEGSKLIREMIESKSSRLFRLANWQFRCLIGGAILYVAWHIIEMYLRVWDRSVSLAHALRPHFAHALIRPTLGSVWNR